MVAFLTPLPRLPAVQLLFVDFPLRRLRATLRARPTAFQLALPTMTLASEFS